MKRAILILAALSGLLCAGLIVAYLYMRCLSYSPSRAGKLWNGGLYQLALFPDGIRGNLYIPGTQDGTRMPTPILSLGLKVVRVPTGNSTAWYAISAPWWLLIGVPAIPPLAYVGVLRKTLLLRHRRKRGLCLACGYDLRESKERCPECGSPTLPKA